MLYLQTLCVCFEWVHAYVRMASRSELFSARAILYHLATYIFVIFYTILDRKLANIESGLQILFSTLLFFRSNGHLLNSTSFRLLISPPIITNNLLQWLKFCSWLHSSLETIEGILIFLVDWKHLENNWRVVFQKELSLCLSKMSNWRDLVVKNCQNCMALSVSYGLHFLFEWWGILKLLEWKDDSL